MRSYHILKNKMMKDKEFKKLYDALGPEFEVAEALMEKRIQKKLSQAALAKKVGTKQSAISRLESGTSNPSLIFLKKVAHALEADLHISFS